MFLFHNVWGMPPERFKQLGMSQMSTDEVFFTDMSGTWARITRMLGLTGIINQAFPCGLSLWLRLSSMAAFLHDGSGLQGQVYRQTMQ